MSERHDDTAVIISTLEGIREELSEIRKAIGQQTITVNNQPLEPNAVRAIINGLRRERELGT